MTLFICSFFVVLLLFAGMSIGVLSGRAPIKGSCGGMSALGLDTECDICGGDPNKCDSEQNPQLEARRQALPYDAMSEAQRVQRDWH